MTKSEDDACTDFRDRYGKRPGVNRIDRAGYLEPGLLPPQPDSQLC
jgi:hypothetical protein